MIELIIIPVTAIHLFSAFFFKEIIPKTIDIIGPKIIVIENIPENFISVKKLKINKNPDKSPIIAKTSEVIANNLFPIHNNIFYL